jgi:hypothetical protein
MLLQPSKAIDGVPAEDSDMMHADESYTFNKCKAPSTGKAVVANAIESGKTNVRKKGNDKDAVMEPVNRGRGMLMEPVDTGTGVLMEGKPEVWNSLEFDESFDFEDNNL